MSWYINIDFGRNALTYDPKPFNSEYGGFKCHFFHFREKYNINSKYISYLYILERQFQSLILKTIRKVIVKTVKTNSKQKQETKV